MTGKLGPRERSKKRERSILFYIRIYLLAKLNQLNYRKKTDLIRTDLLV